MIDLIIDRMKKKKELVPNPSINTNHMYTGRTVGRTGVELMFVSFIFIIIWLLILVIIIWLT